MSIAVIGPCGDIGRQIALDAEARGIRGTIGLAFVDGNRGVHRVFGIPISDDEGALLGRAPSGCARGSHPSPGDCPGSAFPLESPKREGYR